ncbi:MAG: cellulase family glycosylhydrolase [Bdellovibrionales bacterium]
MDTAVIEAFQNTTPETNGLQTARIVIAFLLIFALGCSLGACATDRAPPIRPLVSNAENLPSPSETRALKRGINLSRWWEAEHDRALDDSDIRNLQAMGFDFVRLPLDPLTLGKQGHDESMQEEKLKALRRDLELLIDAGFSVVLDLHPKDDFQRRLTKLPPGEAKQKLEETWRNLGEAIKGLPPKRLLLELLNEPKFSTSRWWKIQNELIVALRPIYPQNTFVATTSPDSGWWQLDDLKPYHDSNVIYDFHFYEPMAFTHHEVEWSKAFDPKRAAQLVPYPVDPEDAANQNVADPAIRAYLRQKWNRDKLARLIEKIAAWEKRHKAKLICFEFGVYHKHVDERSRMGWLRDLREEFEKKGIPWAMWEYKGPFGLLPINADHGDAPDKAITEALGIESGKETP